MHETVIAQNIIEEAKKHGEIESISLEIGQLAHVPANDLIATLKSLAPTWMISYKEKKAKVECPNCNFKGNPKILERGHDHFVIECPSCKSTPDLVDGTDIVILSVGVK